MGFKDELRQGSFRGVKFFTDTSTKTLGRRAVQHEIPKRDLPFTDDNGRVAETYELEGHILGDDYFTQKKELEKIFTKEGPGELIHPYYGAVFVQVGTVTIQESNLSGFIAKFSAKFLEAGDNRFPKGVNDKGAILLGSIDAAEASAVADFEKKFSVAGLPQNALDSARSGIGKAADQFKKISKLGGDIADNINQLAFTTRNLVAEVNDLMQAPSALAARLQDSFNFLQGAFTKAEDQANALATFFGFGDEDVSGDTPTRVQEKQNQDALNNFMRRIAAAKAAGSAANGTYVSFQDAEAARIEITNQLEEQLTLDDGTEVFQNLADINANLVDALPDVDLDLPNIKTIEIVASEPTLLLTYDLFESLDNEQDIIDRNGIRHPAFIPSGKSLEVLDG